VAVLRGGEADLELARALVDSGAAALRRAGRRADGRARLAEGLERARAAAPGGWSAAPARSSARPAGAPASRCARAATRSPPASVAEHAAQGRSNAEIAQALFVTVKTVEMHLTGVYRKLDITALAAALTGP